MHHAKTRGLLGVEPAEPLFVASLSLMQLAGNRDFVPVPAAALQRQLVLAVTVTYPPRP